MVFIKLGEALKYAIVVTIITRLERRRPWILCWFRLIFSDNAFVEIKKDLIQFSMIMFFKFSKIHHES